jgi:two-component system phosphate regulon sensor histidine kinase PhoR
MPLPRLFWKLYTGYVVLLLVTLGIVVVVVLRTMTHNALQETRQRLYRQAALLQAMALPALQSSVETELQTRLRLLETTLHTRFTVIGADGTVLADSAEEVARMDNHVERPEIVAARAEGIGTATRVSYTLGLRVMYLALPVQVAGRVFGYVRAAAPLTGMDASLQQLRLTVLLGAGVAAGLGLGGGFFFVRRLLQPLTSVTMAVTSMARESQGQALALQAGDEIHTLAEAATRVGEHLRERMETLSRERNQLFAVLGSMVEGVIAVDRDERVVHMNHAASTMLRVTPETSIGQHLWEVTRLRAIIDVLSDTIRGTEEVVREARVVEPVREQILQLHAAPLRNSRGELAGAVVVLHDVTELRRLENIRREFVANVSHELKTPVTAIKGFVETLRDGALDDRPQAERFLDIVARHSERLQAIIEDLLSLSRLEQEEEAAELARTETACADVLQAAVQDCAVKAETRQIAVSVTCDASLRARINAPLIEQAVVNLLDNAINSSKPGSTVWVGVAQDGPDIIIQVRDQGVGIPQQHLPRLFERFYRVDKARSREHGGTGLGLAIVKHIALAHSGRVSVTSTVGKGSTFTLHLPATPPVSRHL